MRLVTFISSVLALAFWVCALSLGIYYFRFEACALQGDSAIFGVLLHKVILPSVMSAVSLIALIFAIIRKPASKVVLAISLASLASMAVYYASFTGLVVDEPMLSFCSSQRSFNFHP